MDLNKFLQPNDSPVQKENAGTLPWQIGTHETVQQNSLRTSQVNIKRFVQLSGTASGTVGIGNGTTAFLATSLTPLSPRLYDINFAVPYIALYQGTVAVGSMQIYPTVGSGITPGAYTVQGELDYHGFGTSNPQTLSIWKGIVTDNNAGNQTILFATIWKILNYNSGTTT